MGLLCTTGTVVMHLHCGFLYGVRWRHSRAQNSELHFLVNFFTSLRKDIVANYTSIWTLFSPSVRGPDVLRNALNTSPKILKCGVDIFQNAKNRPQSSAKYFVWLLFRQLLIPLTYMSIIYARDYILPVCIVPGGGTILLISSSIFHFCWPHELARYYYADFHKIRRKGGT